MWQATAAQLAEDNVRRDALPELAELTKESHLNLQHALELWTHCQRASLSPNLTPIRDCGPDNSSEQARLGASLWEKICCT